MTNFIIYDLEAHNTDGTRPYNMTFYRLSKKAGRYERDPTPQELKKSIDETIAFAGETCINNALDFCLKLKGEERRVKNKTKLNIIYECMLIMVVVLIIGLF